MALASLDFSTSLAHVSSSQGSALGPAEEEAGPAKTAGPPSAPSSLTSDPAEEDEDEDKSGEMAVDDDDETQMTAPPSWEQWKAPSPDTQQASRNISPAAAVTRPNAHAGPGGGDVEADSELSSTDTE